MVAQQFLRQHLTFFMLILLSVSCKDDESEAIGAKETETIREEAEVEAYFQELDDMAGVVVQAPTDDEFSGGRKRTTITVQDPRFSCPGISVTITPGQGSTPQNPRGTIFVNFGEACADNRGNVRSGELIITYSGRRFMPGSNVIIALSDYMINDIKLDGTRSMTNVGSSSVASPTFNVVLQDGRATFPDDSTAERSSNITWTWVRAANPLDDEIVVSAQSTANGKTRDNISYSVSLDTPLRYKRFCGIAVEGIKRYQIGETSDIVVDYGSGDCDRSVTISTNGFSKTVTF